MDVIWQCRRRFLIVGEGSDEDMKERLQRAKAIETIERAEKELARA